MDLRVLSSILWPVCCLLSVSHRQNPFVALKTSSLLLKNALPSFQVFDAADAMSLNLKRFPRKNTNFAEIEFGLFFSPLYLANSSSPNLSLRDKSKLIKVE